MIPPSMFENLVQLNLKIALIFIMFIGCREISSDKKAKKVNLVTSDSSIVIKENISHQDNLEIARQFAVDFLPDTTMQGGMKKMNNFPDSVVKAFKAIRLDRHNQEKYLTLLYLKIYRGHLQCCHQSYEIRVKPYVVGIDSIADPLVFEFNLITKQFDNNKRIEMITSGLAHSWVESNKRLLKYDLIKKEYKTIKEIEENITKRKYR